MKAVTYKSYGAPMRVLELGDIARPDPAADEVLVKVRAASLNRWDWHFVTGLPYITRVACGLRRPRREPAIVGSDIAGVVVEVGADVARLQPGDQVYGAVDFGGCAQFIAVPADKVQRMPSRLSFEQAAAVPVAGMTAVQGLVDAGHVTSGDRVLINGASGAVGTFAVQIAKALGAQVTGVCSSRDIEQTRALGADRVIDDTDDGFADRDERYDVMLDLAPFHTLSESLSVLAKDGRYVLFGNSGGDWLAGALGLPALKLRSWFVSQTLIARESRPSQDSWDLLHRLIQAGRVKPVIDRSYRLADTATALDYIGQGHARANVVIKI